MKNLKAFIKLTSFELDRFSKFLVTLMSVTVIANIAGFIIIPMSYINDINKYMVEESASVQVAIEDFSHFSLSQVINSVWVMGPIALGIISLVLYSFFIWYREWFGKNTFAYRLLMLPIPRMSIYFSKLVVIFIGIFSLVSIQIVSLYIGYLIGTAIMPSEYTIAVTFIEMLYSQDVFYSVLPLQGGLFFLYIGLGLVGIIVLYTLILLERSFAIKGMVIGVIYGIISVSVAVFPLLFREIFNNYFILYDSELALLVAGILILISSLSILISRYLINHKITI